MMRLKVTMGVMAIALILPVSVAAQRAGFRAGIVTGVPAHGVTPFGGGFGYGGVVNPYYNPYGGIAVPRVGIPGAGFYSPYGSYIPGGVIIVAPRSRGGKVAPGLAPARGRVHSGGPGTVLTNPGRGRSFPRNSRTSPGNRVTSFAPNSPVQPAGTDIFVTGANNRPQPANAPSSGIGIGSTRAQVLAQYGSPTVSMANSSGEALVFGATTFVIQNGVVVQVNTR